MASYKVILKPSVEKDVRSFPKSVVARLLKQIEALKNRPFPICQQTLGLEERLEEWLIKDIGLVSDDLLVIGRQFVTEHSGATSSA